MDTQKLSIAIQAFIKKQSANAAYYEENWNERKERKAYYQISLSISAGFGQF